MDTERLPKQNGPPEFKDPVFSVYFWRKIITTLAINWLTVPLVATLLFASGLIDESLSQIIENFQRSYYSFFWPLSRSFDFFTEYAIKPALLEELIYRGPIRIAVGFLFFFSKKPRWFFLALIWTLGLALNFHWATQHITHEFMWILVFTAGTAWLWLVINTNRLWPSVVCHTSANFSIYILIKVYQFLY